MIEQPDRKDGAQDAMDMIVQLVLRYCAALDCLFQIVAKKECAGFFLIEPCMRCLDSGVCSAPIRENESFELEVPLENISQQKLVLARVIAIHPVVGTHYGAGV